MNGIANRHYLITGGAQGIGRATAEKLISLGARVTLADLPGSSVEATASELSVGEAQVQALHCDVRKSDEIDRMVADAAAGLGSIDGLINNAGVIRIEPFFDITPESWEFVQSVNVTGLFFVLQRVARHMIDAGVHGAIVNLASEAGRRGSEWSAHYGASKAAAISITRSASLALVRHGIRVNAVAPGLTQTNMWDNIDRMFVDRGLMKPGENKERGISATPAGRPAHPEDIAKAIAYLLSDEAEYVHGTTLDVNGGRIMS
jgi:D-sorbitol dehydrogenase (acceptor)